MWLPLTICSAPCLHSLIFLTYILSFVVVIFSFSAAHLMIPLVFPTPLSFLAWGFPLLFGIAVITDLNWSTAYTVAVFFCFFLLFFLIDFLTSQVVYHGAVVALFFALRFGDEQVFQ